MPWIVKIIIYQVILFIPAITGLIHYSKMDKASKIIVWFLSFTFIFEAVAAIFAVKYNNSLVVFHIYNPIQLLLVSIYFNNAIDIYKKHRIGWMIGIAGIGISIANSAFLQHPLTQFNSNFLIVESFLIIGMCLHYFYQLMSADEVDLNFSNTFWFTSLLLIFWSFTFCYWLISPSLYKSSSNTLWLDITIWAINIICYTGFALVFLSYAKLKKA